MIDLLFDDEEPEQGKQRARPESLSSDEANRDRIEYLENAIETLMNELRSLKVHKSPRAESGKSPRLEPESKPKQIFQEKFPLMEKIEDGTQILFLVNSA